MKSTPTIGFIGFGEAGFGIAKGLAGAGASGISSYDINRDTPVLGEKIRRRAQDSGVRLLSSSADLAAKSDIILSTVTADRAMEAAQQTATFLEPRHTYADLNSVSPHLKKSIAAVISRQGARFVEAAIMSPVAGRGHRVPMFLSGADAPGLVEALSPYGMNLDVISENIGAAAAAKMCRSIVVKGLEALLLECVLAAVPNGADERVFATLDETFPGMNWKKLASYMTGRVVEHGERRARELDEVAAMLRDLGIDPIMTEAAARRQDWCARLNLLPKFGGEAPADYREVVKAITQECETGSKD
jgi:3-hydroxyisobutyrate dehydrogenase-like beta-hydroxyacid dehydrogenase